MSEPLVFEMPLPPNLGNKNFAHWAMRTKAKNRYLKELDERVTVRWMPRAPAQPFAKAVLRVEMHVAGVMDRDNAEARLKFPIDWLKTRRYIVDDRSACLARDGEIEQVRVGPTRAKLMLTLTAAA